jgi:hypothetical protein
VAEWHSRALAITETHRLAQISLANEALKDSSAYLSLLDFSRVEETFPRYRSALGQMVDERRALSSALGSSYYRAMRSTAEVTGDFSPRLAASLASDQISKSLLVTGPVAARKILASGGNAEEALRAATVATGRAVKRHVLNGGRGTVLNGVFEDSKAKGWVRVTDGMPCAFCAMLASRGAVYKSGNTAAGTRRETNTGAFKVHDGCGCSVLPFWSADADYALGRSVELRDQYNAAIGSGKDMDARDRRLAFRRAWERKNPPTRNRPVRPAQVIEALAEEPANLAIVPEPFPEWRNKWEAAKAKLPAEGSQVGRIPLTEAQYAERVRAVKAEIAQSKARVTELESLSKRVGSRPYEALEPALQDEAQKFLRYRVAGSLRASLDADLENARNFVKMSEQKLATIPRYTDDLLDPDDFMSGPGAVAESHLAAVIEAGAALDEEITRRITQKILGSAGEVSKTIPPQLKTLRAERAALLEKVADGLEQGTQPALDYLAKRGYLKEATMKDLLARSNGADPLWESFTLWQKANARAISGWNDAQIRSNELLGRIVSLEKQLEEGARLLAGEAPDFTLPSYARALREATIEVLSEIRPMGNTRAPMRMIPKGKFTEESLRDAMDFAEDSYPTEWGGRLKGWLANDRKVPEITIQGVDRGWNSGGTQIGLSKREIGPIDGDNGSFGVGVHELGHTYERVIDGLQRMEWAFSWKRGQTVTKKGVRKRSKKLPIYGNSKKERFYAGEWRSHYTGKIYGDTASANYEIFTTGIDSLMGGRTHFWSNDGVTVSPLGYDYEFRRLILGVLSVL